MKRDFNIVVLSDLHFGPNKDNENISESLKKSVYPFIQTTKPDMIVIAGDDTDERISFDQSAARHHLSFVNEIIRFKKKDNKPCAVRFVAGTESHQRNQLQAYQYFTFDSSFDVKLISTVTEEEYEGNHILYIPEESVQNKREFYKNTLFSGKVYDYAFGHGTFDFVGYTGWGDSSEKSLRGSPTWTYNDFRDHIKHVVVFGHIHIRTNYKQFIYYCGSLTRFSHSEEKSKGFLNIHHDYEKQEVKVSFIKNDYAPIYLTRAIKKEEVSYSPEKLVHLLKEEVMKNNIYELRILVKSNSMPSHTLSILKKYFSDHNERVRIEIIREGKDENDLESKSSEFAKKHERIVNPQDWRFNTVEFAKTMFGYDIDPKEMEDIITKCKSFNS